MDFYAILGFRLVVFESSLIFSEFEFEEFLNVKLHLRPCFVSEERVLENTSHVKQIQNSFQLKRKKNVFDSMLLETIRRREV